MRETPSILPPPVSLKTCWQQQFGSEPIIEHAQSELDPLGHFAVTWLLAGEQHLFTASEDGDAWRMVCQCPRNDVEKISLTPRNGGTLVSARMKTGDSLPLAFFHDARRQEFTRVIDRLNASLSGCLSATPHADEAPPAPRDGDKTKRVYRRVFRFAHPYRFHLLLILLFLTLSTLAGLVTPYMSKLFIDRILKPDPVSGVFELASYLPWAVLAFLAAHVVQLVFGMFQARLAGYVGHRTVYDIRGAIYEKLQDLSLSFFDKNQTGSIIARVNQDTGELRRLLVDFIPLSLEGLFTLMGVGLLLFYLNWKITLTVLIPVAFLFLFMRYMMPRLHVAFHRFFSRRSLLSAAVSDSISGMRVVKAFGQGNEEIRKFDQFSTGYRDSGISLEYRWAVYHPILHFIIISGTVIVWGLGGQAVINGRMTIGELMAYLAYLGMFYRPVFMITRMFNMIVTSLSASERIFDILDTEPDVKEAANPIPSPHIQGIIEFDRVTFGYDPAKPVIREMSFKTKANELIGLVGKSGAGKSTMINLIARLYDPTSGVVRIDGEDVRNLSHADLRKQIGVVLQETFLFSGTIYDNIAYARPEATPEDVLEAAEAARAHEFIMRKPDAYDTQVGERGNRLSGGEKQRISIARAILRNPRILILDEATSSVDTETELHIQQALEKLTRGRTTIAIAHRLSTLRNCDRLLVIDDGQLVETGTHQELMANNGIFANLVKAQRQMSEIIAVKG